MSCNSFVTSALGLSCKNATGGIQKIYLFDGPVSTSSGADGISGFTASEATNLFEWILPRQTGNISETITSSVENGSTFYETNLVISLIGLDKVKQDQLKLLAHSTASTAIVRDNTGNFWYVGGENGLDLTSSSATTGTAFGDRNGYEITLTHLGSGGMELIDVADDAAFETLVETDVNITLVKS